MAFYDLSALQRKKLTEQIHREVHHDFLEDKTPHLLIYYAADDTYIRRAAYVATGRIYKQADSLRTTILRLLAQLLRHENPLVRQTSINAAGEIGKWQFETVQPYFDTGLFDKHPKVRNAVIGSVKKMGAVNPEPILQWARLFLHHPDKEIRREICHGIELRGRKYPGDILPLLKELENDTTARVRNTLVHVVGQIAYQKGCLSIVIQQLQTWSNRALVKDCVKEIIDVHHRYANFAYCTPGEAMEYIKAHIR